MSKTSRGKFDVFHWAVKFISALQLISKLFIKWPAIENSLKRALVLLLDANHFPCVRLLGKSHLTSGHENVIHVTSDNLDDFKIIQISNISVSFVEKNKKGENSQ